MMLRRIPVLLIQSPSTPLSKIIWSIDKITVRHCQYSFLTRYKGYFCGSQLYLPTKNSDCVTCKLKCLYSSARKSSHMPLVSSRTKPLLASKLPANVCFNPYIQIRNFSGQSEDATPNIWMRTFLWLSESTPVSYAQDFLLNIHDSTGLPWWATIMVTTILIRTVMTVPLAIYQNYILAKVENIQLLELPEIAKQLKMETHMAVKQFNWSENVAKLMYKRSLQKQWNELIIRDNCHPFKASVLIWFQIPTWIFLSVALRNLVYMLPHRDEEALITNTQLSIEGFGWIENLLIPDCTLIIPISLGLINLLIVEIQNMSKIRKDSKLHKYLTNLFRVVSVITIPIAAYVPTALSLYWITSSVYGLLQNLILLSPRVKRFSRIPETPSELERPYEHIASEIRLKASRMTNLWKSKV